MFVANTRGPVAAAMMATVLLSGCAADGSGPTETGTGAMIGAAAGAALGALVARDSGTGALVGAVGGAIAGGMVGAYMEEQRKDFEKALAQQIDSGAVRVEKLPDDRLLVAMTSETAFDTDSSDIKPAFYPTMDDISAIVNKYGKTQIVVAGHTDNTGSDEYNQALSERRAGSVETYFTSSGVIAERMTVKGFGESEPVATNDTEEGRQLNRRVDLLIVPIVAS